MASKLSFILDFKATGANLINQNVAALKDFAKSAKDLIAPMTQMNNSLNANTQQQNANNQATNNSVKTKGQERQAAKEAAQAIKDQTAIVKKLEEEQKKLASTNMSKKSKDERDASKALTDAIKKQLDASKNLLNQQKANNAIKIKEALEEERKAVKEVEDARKKLTDITKADTDAKKKNQEISESLGNSLKNNLKVGIGAVIAQLTAMVAYMVIAGDKFKELSAVATASGVEFSHLQEVKEGFKEAGISVEEYADNLSELNKRILEGASLGSGPAIEYLDLLKLDVKELAQLKPEEQFKKINDRLNELQVNSQQRKQIFGELGGDALFSVAENLDKIKAKSDDLKKDGLIVTPGEVEGLSAFSDVMDRLTTRMDAFSAIVGGQVLPLMVELFDEGENGEFFSRDAAEEFSVFILNMLALIKQLVIATKKAWAVIVYSWNIGVNKVGNMFDEFKLWIQNLGVDIAIFVENITSIDIVGMIKELGVSAFEQIGVFFRAAISKILEWAQELISYIPGIGTAAAEGLAKVRKELAQQSNEKDIEIAKRKENDAYLKAEEERKKNVEAVEAQLKNANIAAYNERAALRNKENKESEDALKDSISKQIQEQDKLDNFNGFSRIQEEKYKAKEKEDAKAAAEAAKKTALEGKAIQDAKLAEIQKEIDLVNSNRDLAKISKIEAVKQTEELYQKMADLAKSYGRTELEVNTILVSRAEVRKKYNEDEKRAADEAKRAAEEAVRKAKEASDKRLQVIKDEIKNNTLSNEIIGTAREEIYTKNLELYDKLIEKSIEEKRTELEINEIKYEKYNYIKAEADLKKKMNDDQNKIAYDLQVKDLEQQGKKLEALKLQTAERRKQLEYSLKDASSEVRDANLKVFDKVENIDFQKARIDVLSEQIDKLKEKRQGLDIFDNSQRLDLEDQITNKMKERSAIMDELGMKQDEMNTQLKFTVKDFEGLLNVAYGSMSTLISDTIAGTKSLKDSFKELFANLLKYLLQVFQQMLVIKALQMFGFGGGSFVGAAIGGSGSTPKFHVGGMNGTPGVFSDWQGMQRDETAAILQRGEAVVTEEQQQNISDAIKSDKATGTPVINNILLDANSIAKSTGQTPEFEEAVVRAYNRNRDSFS